MSEEKTLQEKVFEACDNMAYENKKITRDTVRAITGGSDRDLSKYISEWKAKQQKTSLVVAGTDEISQQSQELIATESQTVPASVPNAVPTQTVISHADIEQVKSNAAQRVKALRIAEIQVARAYQENPNLLPPEILEEIAQAEKAAISNPINHRTYYDPNALAQMVIASL